MEGEPVKRVLVTLVLALGIAMITAYGLFWEMLRLLAREESDGGSTVEAGSV